MNLILASAYAAGTLTKMLNTTTANATRKLFFMDGSRLAAVDGMKPPVAVSPCLRFSYVTTSFLVLKMAAKLSSVGWSGIQCGGTEVISASDWMDEDTNHAIGASTYSANSTEPKNRRVRRPGRKGFMAGLFALF